MSKAIDRKIADLILLIPAEQQLHARRRIDNLIRVVNTTNIPELNWKSINGEVESLNEKLTNQIMHVVCSITQVNWTELKSKCRKREINDVRQTAMFF